MAKPTAGSLNPWLEALAASSVLLLHIHLAAQAIQRNPLYLGGDSTRDVWQALNFLKRGLANPEGIGPYATDLFSLLLTPPLAVWGASILFLQMGSLVFSTLTILVLYCYSRRAFGLVAGCLIGILYATSPLLLGHCAIGCEFNIILWVSLLLLLGTIEKPWAPFLQALLAGLFTSLHIYFLFPLAVYLGWKTLSVRPRVDHLKTWKKGCVLFLLFFIGFSPCLAILTRPRFLPWFSPFLQNTVAHGRALSNVARDLLVQLSWSLDSITVWGPARANPRLTWPVCAWLLLAAASLRQKETRGLVASLACGLALAALIPSDYGLGMRHLLAFLPFYWLPLGMLLSQAPARWARTALICLSLSLAFHQYRLVGDWLRQPNRTASSTEEIDNHFYVSRLAALLPIKSMTVIANDSNFYFALKLLCPDMDIRIVPKNPEKKLDLAEFLNPPRNRSGILLFGQAAGSDWADSLNPTLGRKSRVHIFKKRLIGTTSFDLYWNRRPEKS